MMRTVGLHRVLTGITTSGTPHLGNYVGAIRPAIAAGDDEAWESYYFLADLHALVGCLEPERVAQSTFQIAATWLALGLDTNRAVFYRQSDIPEVTELNWLLSCVAAKGLMNRAHAYKAAVAANEVAGEDPDRGVSMGLFNYPVLMAADILLFNARRVPVGKDQLQHLEMVRDIARRFNHRYGEYFDLPEGVVDEDIPILPGNDGRKMSKSYNNTIPLWLSPEELRKAIMNIRTDSGKPGEPKDPDQSPVYGIYCAFASPAQRAVMRRAFGDGIAWSDAKQAVFELVNEELSEARERYQHLIAEPAIIEAELLKGAERARATAKPFMDTLRHAAGIRPLRSSAVRYAHLL